MNELMDDIRAAADSVEAEYEEDLPEETPDSEVTDADPVVESPDKEETPAPESKEVKTPSEEPEKPDTVQDKAPASWTPGNREHWAKLPDPVKQQVAKREAEVNQVLQQSAESRRAVSQLQKTLAPFEQGLISAGYQDPFSAINQMLTTESHLRTGNSQQKAHMVANLINQYGIDIQTLDSILAGNPATQTAKPGADLESLIDQRMAPFNQYIQQQQVAQQYAAEQQKMQAHQSVQSFSQNAEFLNDVRMDMADLMDMAAARGQTMTIDDAYQKACAINPEVSKIVRQREEEKRIMGTQSSMQQKQAISAASLVGKQSGEPVANGEMSLRETIQAAWDENIRGG